MLQHKIKDACIYVPGRTQTDDLFGGMAKNAQAEGENDD
jgi:hypothetical protein